MVKKEKSKNYIENKEFYNELKDYIEETRINPKCVMSDRLGKMIYDTVEGFSKKFSYRDYTYKDDMISLAVYYCCRYLKNYDLSKRNVHAYVSKIAENAFKATINKEKQQLYTKYKYQMNNFGVINSCDETGSTIQTRNVGEFFKIDDFIKNFENSDRFKKKVKNCLED